MSFPVPPITFDDLRDYINKCKKDQTTPTLQGFVEWWDMMVKFVQDYDKANPPKPRKKKWWQRLVEGKK